jgi:hypothetical protein
LQSQSGVLPFDILGVGYQDIPGREYQFVFIDGPETTAPSDEIGTASFSYGFRLVGCTKLDFYLRPPPEKKLYDR